VVLVKLAELLVLGCSVVRSKCVLVVVGGEEYDEISGARDDVARLIEKRILEMVTKI
jgi:hypothetical protein